MLRVDQVDATRWPEVAVSLTARNANGVPLTDLMPADFEITEDRQAEPRQIVSLLPFVNPEVQLAVVLAVDISGSMQGQAIVDAKAAASRFVAGLGPQDAVALIAFNHTIRLDEPFPQLDPTREHGFNPDKAEIQAIIGGLEAVGATPLYDAAYKAVRLVAQQAEGNRAVLLFTDGKDEGSTPDLPGSAIANTEDAIQEANRHNIPVFTIGLGDDIDRQWLERVAMRTGGTYQQTPTSGDLTRLFQNVADLLKQQYRVTYRSGVPADGAMHHLRVDFKKGVLDAFDAADWGPVPLQIEPTALPPTAAPVPPEAPTAAPQQGGVSAAVMAGIGLLVILAGGGFLLTRRSRPAAQQQSICPNCGRDVGPDGLCPDCKVPGVPKPGAR
jgi:VWFA-related protein